ncbi:hypothetical protein [Pseudomonas aeruginosa]|uniref:hypothetical protein n=1 Tax=Pseudomonas aeruginosa TaxID=287 RepID=UPI003F4E53DC
MTAYIHPKILTREIRHFHLFCGLGGGAKGFNKANPRVGNLQGKFRCIGGIDVNAAAIRDFERLSGSRGTVLDLFDRDQFKDFHGKEPPREWREATAADIRHAAGGEYPHIVFLSAPLQRVQRTAVGKPQQERQVPGIKPSHPPWRMADAGGLPG